MPKRYLVTGGAGFLGRSLVRRLVAQGSWVRVLDDDSRGKRCELADLAGAVEFLSGDVRNAETVKDACRGVDGVCHLAFVNGTEYFYSKPDLVLEVGVKGIVNVLDGCLAHDVQELLLVSSSEVYQSPPRIPTDESAPLSIPDPLNPRYSYAGGKIISELLALNYGRAKLKRVLIVRPHNVYGPDMGHEHVIPQFVDRLRDYAGSAGKGMRVAFKIQGSGAESRSFIYIDDFTSGVMRVLGSGEHCNIYHVGTMQERTIRQLASDVGECLGVDIVIEAGPLQPGSVLRRCPDIRKVEKLGFVPAIAFAEGLKRTVDWYLRNPRA